MGADGTDTGSKNQCKCPVGNNILYGAITIRVRSTTSSVSLKISPLRKPPNAVIRPSVTQYQMLRNTAGAKSGSLTKRPPLKLKLTPPMRSKVLLPSLKSPHRNDYLDERAISIS